MSKKTSFFSILLMSLLVVSVLAGLARQNSLVSGGNNNKLGNVGLSMAAWGMNGNTICNAAYNQMDHQIISDGAGGAIIVWADFRSGGGVSSDIYAQKINATGYVQWTANGVALCTASGDQLDPQICSDGAGGAIVTWTDARTSASYPDIYARRINSAGVVQWTADGVAICTASNEQRYPQICSTGSNGAIITWMDLRDPSPASGWDIYAQKVNSDGSKAWWGGPTAGQGIPVANGTINQRYPQICSDGTNGALITWRVAMSADDIYAGKIDSTGVVWWSTNGIAICTAANLQDQQQICSDGQNGAIITWQDVRSGTHTDIYVAKMNMAGATPWKSNGIAICNASNDQKYPQICSDGTNGAIITWQDSRASNWDVYARRITWAGMPLWGANGTEICTVSYDQVNPQICIDGANGSIIVWQDERGGSLYDIYAQHIDSSKIVQWTMNGVKISSGSTDKLNPMLCSDGAKGAFIAWYYWAGSTWYDLYVQRAYLALPATPTLNPITPNPSSGLIYLSWTECTNATRYYVFRSTSQINSIAGLSPYIWTDTSIHAYTDNSFVDGTFYYVIVAGGVLLNSSISNCVNVTVAVSGGGEIPAFEFGFLFLGLSPLVLANIRKRTL